MTLEEMQDKLGDRGSRGSKIRCHLLTSGTRNEVADRLSSLLPSSGHQVTMEDVWMPEGFERTKEAQLDKDSAFLGEDNSQALRGWWLESTREATTPNWDIASTFRTHDDKSPGLLLVEAKAHKGELSEGSKSPPSNTDESQANHEKIGNAIGEANRSLNFAVSGFHLSRDDHYQVSNRFAWAWKIASLGTPVVLAYLGFPRAQEMADRSRVLLIDDADWKRTVLEHVQGIVPDAAWGREIAVGTAWVYPTIVSKQIDILSA